MLLLTAFVSTPLTLYLWLLFRLQRTFILSARDLDIFAKNANVDMAFDNLKIPAGLEAVKVYVHDLSLAENASFIIVSDRRTQRDLSDMALNAFSIFVWLRFASFFYNDDDDDEAGE